MSPYIYLRYLFLPTIVIAANLLGDCWNLSVLVICFVIHPVLGLFSSPKPKKPEMGKVYSRNHFRIVAMLFVPVLVATTVYMMISSTRGGHSWLEYVGMVTATGIMNGILGFTLAHEFIHRRSFWEQASGFVLLLQTNYLHYSIEHIRGHHVYACTQMDPHTARKGESFYIFLFRAIRGTFINAWNLENKRLKKKGLGVIGTSNRMIRYLVLEVLVMSAIVCLFGISGIVFFILQGFVAIFLLHITNYLQHYGLLRQENENGKEHLNSHHAWRSTRCGDGLNLFQMDNHADHHMHPNRSYEKLEPHDKSPELPTGYSGMILLALLPSLWFRIMDRRIQPGITNN